VKQRIKFTMTSLPGGTERSCRTVWLWNARQIGRFHCGGAIANTLIGALRPN
jgi:hypothetical protein